MTHADVDAAARCRVSPSFPGYRARRVNRADRDQIPMDSSHVRR